MKKILLMALTGCIVVGNAAIASADTANKDLQVSGSVTVEYRSDQNTNCLFPPDNTANGLKTTFLLNMTQPLTDHLDFYARFSYRDVASDFLNWSSDFYLHSKNDPATIDEYTLNYNNAGWRYRFGAQPLSLGATGLLYDDNRYIGKYIFYDALTATGKVGAIDVNAVAAQSNYEPGYQNDKIYYVHGGYAVNKSKFGLGYARVNYGATTAASRLISGDSPDMNYYTADFGYTLASNLFFSSEFIKSSASANNKGVNLVLFSPVDNKNGVGVAWFRDEEQASIQQADLGNMTFQWGNAQGYGVFWNHKFDKNLTFSFTDFKMTKINDAPVSGMTSDQNTLRAGVTYNF